MAARFFFDTGVASRDADIGCRAAGGNSGVIPEDKAGQEARRKQVWERFRNRFKSQAGRFRDTLAEYYGAGRASDIHYAQAFQLCEYGRQPTKAELKERFPFFTDEP